VQLLEDLKHLYVALTRARRRVIMFDMSDVRIPVSDSRVYYHRSTLED
jgi:ATP-dependent exoDNAse (exonuclease V) beta subunit